jgi:hypothetical protein
MRIQAVLVALLVLTGFAAAQGGAAPSGIGARVDVGVDRSLDNWVELQVLRFRQSFAPDKGDDLESRGFTRLG